MDVPKKTNAAWHDIKVGDASSKQAASVSPKSVKITLLTIRSAIHAEK
jgi:hypothetical protein